VTVPSSAGKRVALYARVSTTRQAEADLSIPDQIRQAEAWCQQHGMTIVCRYIEPGASGTDENRPIFQEMLAGAKIKPGHSTWSLSTRSVASAATRSLLPSRREIWSAQGSHCIH
jgi:Resolvase, N terminal domain